MSPRQFTPVFYLIIAVRTSLLQLKAQIEDIFKPENKKSALARRSLIRSLKTE
jgi:hypothetical protein